MRELCSLLCYLALSAAQVTLLLDMGSDEGSNELYVGGGSLASTLGLVAPGLAMTLLGNGLWRLGINTTAFAVGSAVTYKFRNGYSSNWDTGATWESLTSADCTVLVGGYDHRRLVVAPKPQIIGPVCFNSCAACPPRPPSLPPPPPAAPPQLDVVTVVTVTTTATLATVSSVVLTLTLTLTLNLT